jgi:cell division protein FtsI (penicillin-binding protein 3)
VSIKKSSILNKYFFVVIILVLCGVSIIVKASLVMFVEKDYWMEGKKMYTKENVTIPANRGKIFSSDNKLLASSLPQYRIYMDYKSNHKIKKELFKTSIDSVARGLHKIMPDKSVSYFKSKINNGLRAKKLSAHASLYPNRISYLQYQDILQLPVFRSGPNKSGLHATESNHREKPFGTLASRTIGSLFLDKGKGAKNGLEKSFDDILSGKEGLAHRIKIQNEYLSILDVRPVNGDDILTTLNVDIQDISEKAIVDMLKEVNGALGVVIVMEVKTGDIKAIVNMSRGSDGQYREEKNNAVIDLYEPGSTFKTAAILTALNDQKITRDRKQFLGDGTYNMHGRLIRDHNWRNGGFKEDKKYQNIDEIMMNSSNIGVGVTIEEAYYGNKQQFIDGIRKLVGMNLDLQLEGVAKPIIKDTKDPGFSKLTIPWMSFGYETLLPPINMVTFYNAIANNGEMVKPRFVQATTREGSVIKKYPVEVINPKIASSEAIKDIQEILERVVSEGTGKRAASNQFRVAGKTGTAQLSQGTSGYGGGQQHILSFCGYFPAEQPEYTILVNIKSARGGGGGGGRECAIVFNQIAEHIYAMNLKQYFHVEAAKDTINPTAPYIKKGLINKSIKVLKELDIDYDKNIEEEGLWASFNTKDNQVEIVDAKVSTQLVPSVYGMGARDAVFALQSVGLDVNIIGRGKVYRQSIPNGSKARQGARITIELR